MTLELHHFFILVKPEGEVADLLSSIGMREGARNKHEGQGTSNRRFFFSNGALELLWVHDENEAINGPGRDMLLVERSKSENASPFGVIFSRKDDTGLQMPFKGWKYEPVYFQPPWAFHIGDNSANIDEPLCIYMPFVEPGTLQGPHKNDLFQTVCEVTVTTPSKPLSSVINRVNEADRLCIKNGNEHLMEVNFNENKKGRSHDFTPDFPLIVNW